MNYQDEPLVAEVVDTPRTNAWVKLANNTWLLCTTLFLVTGVLGVPLIFYSQRLSFPQKMALAVVVTVYTAILAGGTCLAVMWAWSTISTL